MYSITFKRHIEVSIAVAWKIISDLEKYADYAPNLRSAKVLEGEGKGLIRHCTDNNGGEWKEECVLWDEGRRYSVQVDTSDYPHPFRSMQGTWGVVADASGTEVTMQFDFQPENDPPIIGYLIYICLMRPAFMRLGNKLMDNWERAMLDLKQIP